MQYRFEGFVLDTATAQLLFNEAEVALEPRIFNLLLFLIQNRNRVVAKDEIVEQIWGGRFTSDAAISTGIKSLRKALNDDGGQQRFIRTQRGKGFRFTGSVEEATEPSSGAAVAPVSAKIEVVNGDTALLDNATVVGNPGKPSLIVLPLQSLMLHEEMSILGEAISHELIQALARLRWLRVIARGTAFQFRLPHVDLQRIGQQLGVRYALCGSMESLKQGWIINIELADCETAELIWADRYEANSQNLYDIRQQIVTKVIASLEMYIPQYEANLALHQSTESLDAWANYHLGLRHMFRFNQNDNAQASDCFRRAIELDPNFARAWGGLSFTRFQDAFVNYDVEKAAAIADARRFAETSVGLDPLDPFTNYNMGRSFWLEADADSSLSWLERSVALSPNFAQGHYSCAFSEILQGKSTQALIGAGKALDTSPLDPLLYAIYGVQSFSHLMNGAMGEATACAEKAARAPGAHFLIRMIAAITYAIAGDKTHAEFWYKRTLALKPDANSGHFFAAFPFVSQGFRERLDAGLKQAGFS